MSGDGVNDVTIPVVFVFQKDAEVLHAAIKNNTDLEVNTGKLIPSIQLTYN